MGTKFTVIIFLLILVTPTLPLKLPHPWNKWPKCVQICVCYKNKGEATSLSLLLSHPPRFRESAIHKWSWGLLHRMFAACVSVCWLRSLGDPQISVMGPAAYPLWQQYGEISLPLAEGHHRHQSTLRLGVDAIVGEVRDDSHYYRKMLPPRTGSWLRGKTTVWQAWEPAFESSAPT
jgi:hypothetical protein